MYRSFGLTCRPVLGGIRSEESFKSDTATDTDRKDHLWRTLRERFPSTQDHKFFLCYWVRFNCLAMPIKNINFKGEEIFFLPIVGWGFFESNGLITAT